MTTAFAPGHVTGLFAVHDEDADPRKKGSRGAGWALRKGAYATVDRAGDPTRVRIDGEPADAVVTRRALELLAPDTPLAVDLHLELPTGQGFGMSAAGTLAACLAAAHLLDLEPELALEATHIAEVEHGTGLGDAVGSWFGGGEVRIKPGCPPFGQAMQVPAPSDASFLFCTLGDPLRTRQIIRNQKWKQRTREHGDVAVDRMLEYRRQEAWHYLLAESAVFSHRLGLMTQKMLDLGERLPDGVSWGQCMLGTTLWVSGGTGDLERAEAMLEGHGPLLRCGVDTKGARMVRHMPYAEGAGSVPQV